MKIKETRRTDATMVMKLCIKQDYYNMGNNDEYENLLINICGGSYNGTELTTEKAIEIAIDILKHTDTKTLERRYSMDYAGLLECVLFELINDASITHIEIEQ